MKTKDPAPQPLIPLSDHHHPWQAQLHPARSQTEELQAMYSEWLPRRRTCKYVRSSRRQSCSLKKIERPKHITVLYTMHPAMQVTAQWTTIKTPKCMAEPICTIQNKRPMCWKTFYSTIQYCNYCAVQHNTSHNGFAEEHSLNWALCWFILLNFLHEGPDTSTSSLSGIWWRHSQE